MKGVKDLFVLVADKNMQATVEALLRRHEALAIHPIESDVRPHPKHDPGCRLSAHEYLRPLANRYRFSMVILDYEGCGEERHLASDIELGIEQRLFENGWENRAAAVVIDPELEAWVWSPSRRVDEACGWGNHIPSLRDWIEERFELDEQGKPKRPKEALAASLREVGRVCSSSLFRQMAGQVSWRGCSDRSFLRLLQALKNWFPIP